MFFSHLRLNFLRSLEDYSENSIGSVRSVVKYIISTSRNCLNKMFSKSTHNLCLEPK